jgi:serralysin
MKLRRSQIALLAMVGVWIGAMAGPVRAFIIDPEADYWLNTASGTRSANGDPATLTWSLVPDGRNVPSNTFGSLGPSDLIAFLDSEFGSDPNEPDLEQRPWFQHFTDAFGRWSELSGATYVYEPNDDGAAHSSDNGVLGVRGDIRIAGAGIDGPSGTLAFNYFPDDGDMVLDTDDGNLFDNSANNNRYFRNVIMHEIGHGFGLDHVNSSTDALLLEPSINTSFDGPQLDEVRAIQYYFGDANEKSNNGLGNDSFDDATSLGTVTDIAPVSVGSAANVPNQAISATATDFVSLANLSDIDFYSFSVSEASLLDVELIPRGGLFNQGQQGGSSTPFDASARVNLVLDVFDTDGTTLLASANAVGKGGIESLTDLSLPAAGEYFVSVRGVQDDTIQLYELGLSVTSAVTYLEADFDTDGDIDAADLGIWKTSLGVNALADADDDGDSDGNDFLIWQQQYTGPLGGLSPSPQAVPEPTSAVLLLTGLGGGCLLRRQWSRN